MSFIPLILANEIKAQKDAYLLPENLKKGVTLLGVKGTLEVKPEQTKAIDPSTSYINVLPDDGYTLSSVTVRPVNETIDENIIPENIKDGISILRSNWCL